MVAGTPSGEETQPLPTLPLYANAQLSADSARIIDATRLFANRQVASQHRRCVVSPHVPTLALHLALFGDSRCFPSIFFSPFLWYDTYIHFLYLSPKGDSRHAPLRTP